MCRKAEGAVGHRTMWTRMKIRACPDCGSTRSGSATGKAKDARCLECDAPMNPNPVFFKYLGGLIAVVVLVLAGAWIVLAGQAPLDQHF
jgi:hypothetical protein